MPHSGAARVSRSSGLQTSSPGLGPRHREARTAARGPAVPSAGPGLTAPTPPPASNDLRAREARGADRSGHKTSGQEVSPTSKGRGHNDGGRRVQRRGAGRWGGGWQPTLRAPRIFRACVRPVCASVRAAMCAVPVHPACPRCVRGAGGAERSGARCHRSPVRLSGAAALRRPDAYPPAPPPAPGGTQEGRAGRPSKQRAGGNAAVQDKPGKVRGCPPAPPELPRGAGRERPGGAGPGAPFPALPAPPPAIPGFVPRRVGGPSPGRGGGGGAREARGATTPR